MTSPHDTHLPVPGRTHKAAMTEHRRRSGQTRTTTHPHRTARRKAASFRDSPGYTRPTPQKPRDPRATARYWRQATENSDRDQR